MAKISVEDVDKELYRKMKIEAATRGITIKALVLQAIMRELGLAKKAASK